MSKVLRNRDLIRQAAQDIRDAFPIYDDKSMPLEMLMRLVIQRAEFIIRQAKD